jgi:hypothetical protein
VKTWLALFFCTLGWAGAGELPRIKNCDGQETLLNPKGQITVVMASSQALADTTREFGRAVYPWQGLEDFRLIVVVDLRKSLGSFVRSWTKGRMKADLDEEALALKPWFMARGNKSNPRQYLCAIPDFDGKATEALGWGTDDEVMKVKIFGKDGEKIWMSKNATTSEPLTAKLVELLGPPAKTPPDAEPKKSKILRRRA